MTKYQITENNFKALIDWKGTIKENKCEVKPRTGTFSETEGHDNCSDCPGNYWNGGNCYYKTSSSEHNLKDDLTQINDNFKQIDSISNKHRVLKGSDSEDEFNNIKQSLTIAVGQIRDICDDNNSVVDGFFRNTCLAEHADFVVFPKSTTERIKNLSKGLERYVGRISAITYSQFTAFQNDLKKLLKLQTERKKDKQEYDDLPNSFNRENFAKAGELQNRIDKTKIQIQKLFKELDKNCAFILFDAEIEKILANIKKELFEPSSSNPFAGLSRDKGKSNYILADKDTEITNDSDNGNNNETPSEGWPWGKITLYGGGGLVVVIGLVWFYKWSKKIS